MEPLATLLDRDEGKGILTPDLKELYGGDLSLPPPPDQRPHVAINFVRTVDGPITFNIPGKEGGGEISGKNPQDGFIMGLLRAVFGNMGEGANAVRLNPMHLWTPSFASKEHTVLFEQLRERLGETGKYRTFFFTGTGNIMPVTKPGPPLPPRTPLVLQSEASEAWVITTRRGREITLSQYPFLDGRVVAFGNTDTVDVREAFGFLREKLGVKHLLIEGGATFAGSVIKAGLYDELFLTESNIIAGNSRESGRSTFVWDALFSPEDAPRHNLVSLKIDGREGNEIFERWRRR